MTTDKNGQWQAPKKPDRTWNPVPKPDKGTKRDKSTIPTPPGQR